MEMSKSRRRMNEIIRYGLLIGGDYLDLSVVLDDWFCV